jgi:hypothetical protein
MKEVGTLTTNKMVLKSTKLYPFIDDFVSAMDSINAHKNVLQDIDLQSLSIFFALYIDTCREFDRDGKEMSNEMISRRMKYKFYLRYHSEKNITSNANEVPRQITAEYQDKE